MQHEFGIELPSLEKTVSRAEVHTANIQLPIEGEEEHISCTRSVRTDLALEDAPAVISLHGLYSDRNSHFSRRSELLALRHGAEALNIGLRNQDPDSSGSIEDFTLTRALKDLQTAIDFLRGQGQDNIILAGNSFGGQIALLAAQEDPNIAEVVLLAPLTDACSFILDALPESAIKYWRENGYREFTLGKGINVPFSFGLYQDARRWSEGLHYESISAQVTSVIAGMDEVLPPEKMQRALTPIKNQEVVPIGNADHSFTDNFARLLAMRAFDEALHDAILRAMPPSSGDVIRA